MTRIDIFSGFLGAGKTTLIKKLLADGYAGQKLVLIENEFGEIGIDGGFLKDAGVVVNEIESGCICCSLTGDFREALRMVAEQYAPDRILIEPSGVGKLSEIVAAVQSAGDQFALGGLTTVVDASKARMSSPPTASSSAAPATCHRTRSPRPRRCCGRKTPRPSSSPPTGTL